MKNASHKPTNRIATVRAEKGLTQQELADLVGVHWITVSKLERGLIRLSPKWIVKLMEALKVTAEELLPVDRVLTTIQFAGEIGDGGIPTLFDEDEPRIAKIENGIFHEPSRQWYVVEGNELYPQFHDQDLICFDNVATDFESAYLDRFCMVWVDGYDVAQLGHLRKSAGGKYILTGVDGRQRAVELDGVAVAAIIICNQKPEQNQSEDHN
jgi:DNA-binding XRE family transcriptional regulator